jgi:hypothetical protein
LKFSRMPWAAPWNPTRFRAGIVICTIALSMAGLSIVPAAAEGPVKDPANPPTIEVTGSSLAGLVTSPVALTPAFDPSITDYVLRCQPGINTIHATLLGANGIINALGSHGRSIDIQQDLVENEALVFLAKAPREARAADVDESGRVQYWIRCLPHDFPQLSVSKPGNPPPGWYLTGNFTAASGSSVYSMVLDNNGTPVWYRKPAGSPAFDVTPLPDHSIAWWVAVSFEDYNLGTQATRMITSPDLNVDPHELLALPNGDLMVLSYPTTPNVDLNSLGLGPNATLTDCVIEELDPRGSVVWRWRASDHISPQESLHPSGGDIYHCNSVDVDPITGNVLLSSRHTDAIYLIDKRTGTIIWKMGGNSPNRDHAQILTVANDPEGVFHAQHDARFQPNGDVSLFDDQSWNTALVSRGVEYHIDRPSGTATLIWAYQAPDGRNSGATGSFRRLNGGADNVVDWGVKINSPLFTEVDAQGGVLLSATFPRGEWSYRTVKVPLTALDHKLLRTTAGLPAFVYTNPPKVAFVGPAHRSATGTMSVTITGAGFAFATAVRFGPTEAAAFTVNSDSSITAIAPNGSGIAGVTVTTPGGSSPTTAGSILTAADSSFEGTIGSWTGAGILTPSSSYARSGAGSLHVSFPGDGAGTVASGRYAIPSRALVTGNEWVLAPSRPNRVRIFTAFYDSSGQLISVSRGPLITEASGTWTLLSNNTISPGGAASAALGLEDISGDDDVYLDDTTLRGSNQFEYQRTNEESSSGS